jgi:hypothetical protein
MAKAMIAVVRSPVVIRFANDIPECRRRVSQPRHLQSAEVTPAVGRWAFLLCAWRGRYQILPLSFREVYELEMIM